MNYFTKELLLKINSNSEEVRKQAENDWNVNASKYQQGFKRIKKHLPIDFYQNFWVRNGFHDYTILRIVITQLDRGHSCELQLSNGTETVSLVMTGLTSIQIDAKSFQHCVKGELVWGYSEFEITPDKKICLGVLCDTQNEMKFEFKSINFLTMQ